MLDRLIMIEEWLRMGGGGTQCGSMGVGLSRVCIGTRQDTYTAGWIGGWVGV